MNAATIRTASAGKERFAVLPIVILILAQMGATGDNGALSLATSALTGDLGATTSEIQLANMIYPLVGGAFMIAGGLAGTIVGWKETFRIGTVLGAGGGAGRAPLSNPYTRGRRGAPGPAWEQAPLAHARRCVAGRAKLRIP